MENEQREKIRGYINSGDVELKTLGFQLLLSLIDSKKILKRNRVFVYSLRLSGRQKRQIRMGASSKSIEIWKSKNYGSKNEGKDKNSIQK